MKDRRGFVLIMALWTLAFLAVLAVSIGFGTRQKIALLSRLEDRSQTQLAAEAGVKKAVGVLLDDLENSQFLYSPTAKIRRHNAPGEFAGIVVGGESVEVVCSSFDETSGKVIERYGLCDEQGKLNLNSVDSIVLSKLIADVLGVPDDAARKLAGDIIDWRDYGRHEAEGFFSDDYYQNLENPYPMKEKPFERIDELLLVRGVSLERYDRLRPFLTVWGDGRININTVSAKVLNAIGLDVAVTDKILKARRGFDGVEATADDHLFYRTFDIASEVSTFLKLEDKETRQIDTLNTRNVLTTDSMIYSWRSRVPSKDASFKRTIDVVFNAFLNKFEYWYEK